MKNLLLIISLLCFGELSAQDSLRGPHGGFVVVAGTFRIEAIGCNEYLEIYVFDKYMDPLLNFGMSGEVVFYKEDKTSTSEKLVYYSNDGFTAKFPEYYFPYFKVIVHIKSVPYSVLFRNECLVRN